MPSATEMLFFKIWKDSVDKAGRQWLSGYLLGYLAEPHLWGCSATGLKGIQTAHTLWASNFTLEKVTLTLISVVRQNKILIRNMIMFTLKRKNPYICIFLTSVRNIKITLDEVRLPQLHLRTASKKPGRGRMGQPQGGDRRHLAGNVSQRRHQ